MAYRDSVMTRIYHTLCSLLFASALAGLSVSGAAAEDTGHRLGPGVAVAVGIGSDVTYGNYGVSADATAVTVPLTVVVQPLESVDLTLQVPLAYQSSRSFSSSTSSFVVYPSGGAGRRQNASNPALGAVSVSTTQTAETRYSEYGLGDISFSAGWAVLPESDILPRTRLTGYVKAPSGDKDRGLGTGTVEAGPGLSLSKWMGDLQLFADTSYIFQDSNSAYAGKSYVSYSAGAGLQMTDRLFVSLYAKGSSVRVSGGEVPVEGRIKLNFLQSRRISLEAYALAGFTDASPAVGGGLLTMYQF